MRFRLGGMLGSLRNDEGSGSFLKKEPKNFFSRMRAVRHRARWMGKVLAYFFEKKFFLAARLPELARIDGVLIRGGRVEREIGGGGVGFQE
jgi:hypothetical protein